MTKYTKESVKLANEYLHKAKVTKWEIDEDGDLELNVPDEIDLYYYGCYLTQANITSINEAIALLRPIHEGD